MHRDKRYSNLLAFPMVLLVSACILSGFQHDVYLQPKITTRASHAQDQQRALHDGISADIKQETSLGCISSISNVPPAPLFDSDLSSTRLSFSAS